MILFVTVLFIEKEWLSLFTLLNTGLSRPFYSEILLKIGENLFDNNILLGKVEKKIVFDEV